MPNQAKVAVIDVGSNSIKLLVASVETPHREIKAVFSETKETRISTGISHDQPHLTPESITAGTESISELLRLARNYQPEAIHMVATSAVRDAINGKEFAQHVEAKTGHRLNILSGKKEAKLIGRGLANDPKLRSLDGFLQMDLGGGSLELIHFHNHQIEQAVSLQLGAVRLSEAFLTDREAPLSKPIAEAIQKHVIDTLEKATISFPPTPTIVATGGAITVTRAVLAAEDGLTIEERSPIITIEEITQLRQRLALLSLKERMAIPHLPATRADILPTALLTIETVLQSANTEQLTHSFHNLRYGIAAELLERLQ